MGHAILETEKIFFFLFWEKWLPQSENEFRNSTWTHLESKNGWSWQGPLAPSVPSPTPAGTVTAWCPGLCLSSFWRASRRLPNLSGETMPVLCHLHSAEGLPHVRSGLPVFLSVPIASRPGTEHYWREPVSVLFVPSLQLFMGTDEIPQSLLFSRLNSPGSLSLSS